MKNKQFIWLGTALLLLLFGFVQPAQSSLTPTLAWDANSEPDLAGYTLHYGTASGVYDVSVTLELVTMYTLPLALNPSNDYYFAVTAYNDAELESGYSNEVHFATHDTDGDTLLDGDEIHLYGTDPSLFDTDGDSLDDYEELFTYLTNPLLADSDTDNIDDFEEIFTYGTDPNQADTDGDGKKDGNEIAYWIMKGLAWDGDIDNDGIINLLDSDSDGDGLIDGQDVNPALASISLSVSEIMNTIDAL